MKHTGIRSHSELDKQGMHWQITHQAFKSSWHGCMNLVHKLCKQYHYLILQTVSSIRRRNMTCHIMGFANNGTRQTIAAKLLPLHRTCHRTKHTCQQKAYHDMIVPLNMHMLIWMMERATLTNTPRMCIPLTQECDALRASNVSAKLGLMTAVGSAHTLTEVVSQLGPRDSALHAPAGPQTSKCCAQVRSACNASCAG